MTKRRGSGAEVWTRLGVVVAGLLLLAPSCEQPLSTPASTDVGASVVVNKGRPYYDHAALQSYVDMSIQNISSEALIPPMELVIESVTPSAVTVANADGLTATSEPYLDFGSSLGGDSRLEPGETSATRQLRFDNPDSLRFDFAVRVTAETPGSEAVLLEGDPDSLASEAVYDFDSGDSVLEAEIETTADGARIVRTKLKIAFTPDATVGEFNALLGSVDASITSMLQGVDSAIVRIPDPGSRAALDALKAQLEASAIVRRVLGTSIPHPDLLPNNVSADSPDELARIGHQLEVGAHAAWNARAALSYASSKAPLLIVGDFFGEGPPLTDFGVKLLNPADLGAGAPDGHGWISLGVIAADFGGADTARGHITGMYPGVLDTLLLDHIVAKDKFIDLPTLNNLLLKGVSLFDRNVVVNSSLGFPCAPPPNSRECIESGVLDWIESVRGSTAYHNGVSGGRENRFLHLAAAGNGNLASGFDATVTSYQTGARLLPDLETMFGVPLPNLTNTLVIENRVTGIRHPSCLQSESMFPGDLSAVGTNVWSLSGANSGVGSGLTGTSVAAPQVAGLAAFVWALKPSLTPQGVLDILQKTARTLPGDVGCIPNPRPIIDAYGAVLAVDSASALDPGGSPADAPARLAVLDVEGSGGGSEGNQVFDQTDLHRFIIKLQDGSTDTRDYSRFDLNGDGYTGGDGTAPFNLDIDYPPTHTTVTQVIRHQYVPFQEGDVTDFQVLCYYAYSDLYKGDTTVRDEFLDPHLEDCGWVEPAYWVWPQEPSLPAGTLGMPYRQELTLLSLVPQMPVVEPVSWELASGSFPPGMTIEDGALVGTPTSVGQFQFSVRGRDATGNGEESPEYSLAVNTAESVRISHAPLDAHVDVEIDVQFELLVDEEPVAAGWQLLESDLPEGVDFGSDGRLTGTPTESGAFAFTVKATGLWGYEVTVSEALRVHDLVFYREDYVGASGLLDCWYWNEANGCYTKRVSQREPCHPDLGCFYQLTGCDDLTTTPTDSHFFGPFSASHSASAPSSPYGGSAAGSAESMTEIRVEDGFLVMEGELSAEGIADRGGNRLASGSGISRFYVKFTLRSATDYDLGWGCNLRWVRFWEFDPFTYILNEPWSSCTDEYGCSRNPCDKVLSCDGAAGVLQAGQYGLEIWADIDATGQDQACMSDGGSKKRSGTFQLKLGPLPGL